MARYRRLYYLVGLLLLISATSALKCPDKNASPGREILCYTKSKDLASIENTICHCTTLIHQGHDLKSLEASDVKNLRDSAKEANPNIRVVLSVSDKHELLKNSATTRQEAAGYLTNVLKEVDGIELNVTAGSKDRLVSFMKGLKDDMVNKSLDKMILLVLPTKPEDLAKQFELKELSKYVDLFTVGTHYLKDSDEAYRSFHPSRLMGLFDMLNTDSLVDLISGMGAPKQKILISAPSNAYQFTLKKAEENTPRSQTVEEQPVAIDRKKLCDAMNDGEWTVERDEDLTAPYAFKNTTWIAFEDETSLKIKGKYVILRELAGLGLRDVESDLKNDCGMSLSESVYRAFTEMKRKTREVVLSSLEKDLKGTEISYPRHVRSSDFRIVRVVDTAGKIRAVRENTQTAFACPRQGYFVHPKSCNRFYRCVKFNQEVDDYSVFEFDCPAGLAFDEKTEVCVWPGSVSSGSACPGSSEIEPVPRARFRCPSQPGFYADPQNCRWFFACYDHGGPEMVPYEFRCPFGLVFDEHRLVCEWPWKVPNCYGPGHGDGHGDGHNIYTYGGFYNGQGNYVPQGGIIGQGGFVGQGSFAGQGVDGINVYSNQGGQSTVYGSGAYGGQNVNAAAFDYNGQNVAQTFGAGAGYNEQGYNAGGGISTGIGTDGQNYNAEGVASNGGFDSQIHNAGNSAAIGGSFDGQTYTAGDSGADGKFDGQTYNAAGNAGADGRFDSQTYNAAGNAGADGRFDSQTYNAAGNAGADGRFDTQTYNAAGNAGADGRFDTQTYNAAGNAGADGRFDTQTYNAAGNAGADGRFDTQTYNAAGNAGADGRFDSQTYNAAGYAGNDGKFDGQTYNAASNSGTGGRFDGDTYSAAGNPAAGGGFNSQTYNAASNPAAGGRLDGQTYNVAGNAGADGGFDAQTNDGQSYNAGEAAGSGGRFDGQVYNAGESVKGGIENNGQGFNFDASSGLDGKFDGQIYNANGASGIEANYDQHNINSGNDGATGDKFNGQTYNTGISGEYDEQNYNNAGTGADEQIHSLAGSGGRDDGQTYSSEAASAGRFDGQTYNAGAASGIGADYDDKNYNAAGGTGIGYDGQVHIGPGNVHANGADCDNQQHINGAVDYDDRSSITSGYNAQGGVYDNQVPTSQINTGNSATTVGVNNFAGVTRTPSGFTDTTANFAGGSPLNTQYTAGGTTGYAENTNTRFTAGTAGVTTGLNNFAGETDLSRGVTSQNTLITSGQSDTNFIRTTNPQIPNSNFNTFGSTRIPSGISTISYDNTANGQNNLGLFGTDISQNTGIAGTTVYNSSYNAGSGYPTSTIIPFAARENTYNIADDQRTTPVNSMGLSSTEHFGNQYTNQAEKSFATQSRTPSGFSFKGQTQNTKNFNIATNTFDNSKANFVGVTPSIELVRDGIYNTGRPTIGNSIGTTFGGSTIAPTNFNAAENTNDNSQLIGSSITSTNNDITKFRESTGSTDNFRYNGNTATNTGYRTDINSGTFPINQNSFISTVFGSTFAPNAVTPSTVPQNFNRQGAPVPGVVPLNNARPSVELDNSGIFGTNFVGSSTTATVPINSPSTGSQNTGYKTNEYYDNGGRGTIRYNNGLVASKVTETDIQDYRTSPYTRLPNSFIINASNGENAQSTIQKVDSVNTQQITDGTFTRGGFTKTGPTKTGITTAQVGGSGSYVIGTGVPRAKPNPQLIGEQAFAGNFGTTGSVTNFNAANAGTNNIGSGVTNFGTGTSTANFGAGITTTNFGARDSATNFDSTQRVTNFGTVGGSSNFGARGSSTNFGTTGGITNFGTSLSNGFTNQNTAAFSKSNTASGTTSETAGYSYPKPLVQLEIKGVSTPSAVTQTNFIDSTTPSSIPNIQTYNYQNPIITASNTPNNNGFSTTGSPIGFTTNQLQNFRTTVYQAAKLPQTITTVQPVIDNGVRTVISSTPVPAIISTSNPTYQTDDFSNRPKTFLGVGVSFDQGDYTSTGLSSTSNIDYSDVSTNLNEGNFGQRVDGQNRFTNINYQQSTANINRANQNNKLITSTQDYNTQTNFNTQTASDISAQTGTLNNNVATDFRSTVTIPNQVYLPSSTVAPAIGVTFSRPVVAAEFSQNQIDRASTAGISQNANVADFRSRGTANRILSNQASSNFAPQRPASGILINQASGFNSRGSVNGILTNQASASFNSQESANEFFNNQGSADFATRGSVNRAFSNQASGNFASQRPFNGNQASGNFISRGSANSAFNQAGTQFASQGSNEGGFENGAALNFNSQRTSNRILSNQASANTFSGQNQGFNSQTKPLVGSSVVTSGLNEDVIRQNIAIYAPVKILPEFIRPPSPLLSGIQSTTFAPEVTTYARDFSRSQNRIVSNAALNAQSQNKKVIVKLSDLHPLILGKLGAECTCKADPFAVFRGPNRQSLPINSQNRGPVDLANYDESDIYVDVDNDKENGREIDFIRRIPSNRLIKTSEAKFSDGDDDSIVVTSRGEPPSSTYLPPTAQTSSTYLPPLRPSNEYLPSSTQSPIAPVLRQNQASLSARTQNRQPLLIRVQDDNVNNPTFSRGRSGKALFNTPIGSPNDLSNQGASFDRYGPGGLRSNDEVLQGSLDCARPGLFRHPKFCNKFYACHWDSWKKRYTLHVFNCPVHLAFDASAGACNYPSKGPACQDNKLLV